MQDGREENMHVHRQKDLLLTWHPFIQTDTGVKTVRCLDYSSHWMSCQHHHMHMFHLRSFCQGSGSWATCDFPPPFKKRKKETRCPVSVLSPTLGWSNRKCHMGLGSGGLIAEKIFPIRKLWKTGSRSEVERKFIALSSFQGRMSGNLYINAFYFQEPKFCIYLLLNHPT